MPDIDHVWGNDVGVGPTGDLAVVDGMQLGIERILRRLMTRGSRKAAINQTATVGEYIWHPTYGAGLPQRIGGALYVNRIKSAIMSQIFKEAVVAKQPAPIVTVTPLTSLIGGVSVLIQYNDAVTGTQQRLSFDVNE